MKDLEKNLGKEGTDVISGFKGMIVGYIVYWYGCEQYLLIPKSQDGKRISGEWFDIKRIKIKESKIKLLDSIFNGAEDSGETKPNSW